MPQLIKGGRVVEDTVIVIRDATTLADLPNAPVLVPLALWQAERCALIERGDIGVWLAPADDPAALADDLTELSIIGVDFPAFVDGRCGYSTARLLRERHGYHGELRAIGDVQRDQLALLLQVGFNAFVLADGRDAHDALASLADFTDGYQVTNLRTPWFRRRAGARSAT